MNPLKDGPVFTRIGVWTLMIVIAFAIWLDSLFLTGYRSQAYQIAIIFSYYGSPAILALVSVELAYAFFRIAFSITGIANLLFKLLSQRNKKLPEPELVP